MFICFPALIFPLIFISMSHTLANLKCIYNRNMSVYNYSSGGNRNSYPMEIKPKEKDLPLDTVSCIVWDSDKSEPMFAAGSWDGFVRIYMVVNNAELNKVFDIFLQHPVLCVDFSENGIIFAGLASGDVLAVELQTSNVVVLGNHDAPICGIFWIRQKGCLMTLGFDNFIKFWVVSNTNALQTQFQLPLKTVTCSFDYPYLLIGSIETTIGIINIKNLPNLLIPKVEDYHRSTIERFSKFISSRILSKANTAVIGTIDGRTLIFNFKENYSNKFILSDLYVARVQKNTIRSSTGFYGQVNCLDLGYHNYEGYTVIGGSEDINIFNTNKRSKVKSLATTGQSQGAGTAVRISPKNDYIAYATGSDWLKGLYELETIKKPKIAVVKLTVQDLNDYTSK